MKWTNKSNLPQAFVNAVTNDGYSRGDADISVTQLIKPMRAVILAERHASEIVEDVGDRLWSLFGRAVHKILEEGNRDNRTIVERRLSIVVDGLKISGGMDSYSIEDGALIDWKTASIFKMKDCDYEEWEWQQNVYAEMLRQHGEKITSLEVVAIFKDYRGYEKKPNPKTGKLSTMAQWYPDEPIMRIPLPLWSQEKAQEFIRERVAAFRKAKEQLPICSERERWAHKPGASPTKRCTYCTPREFCEQYKQLTGAPLTGDQIFKVRKA